MLKLPKLYSPTINISIHKLPYYSLHGQCEASPHHLTISNIRNPRAVRWLWVGCICREAASSWCAENCVRKGRRYCLSAASCRSPFLLLAISCTHRTSCLTKQHPTQSHRTARGFRPSVRHKILDIPAKIPYTKQCAAGEIAVPCTRNPLQRG